MRIGIFVSSLGSSVDLDGYVDHVVSAEKDGFDSFWSSQILGLDALTLIAIAGQRTSRIEMGTAVVPTFPRHPLALAQQALTCQAAAGGRLTLGIGVSHKPVVERRFGLEFDRPTLHMREYLSVLRQLIHEGRADFSGELFRVDAAIDVPGATPLPVLVAALGPRMLGIAGELAEGTVTWMVGLKTLKTHIAPRIIAAAANAGRPNPRICVGVPIAVTDDPKAARDKASVLFRRYGELPSYKSMLDIEGAEGPEEVVVVGNEEQVEQQLHALAQAGATDLLAMSFTADVDEEASSARTRALLKSLVGKV